MKYLKVGQDENSFELEVSEKVFNKLSFKNRSEEIGIYENTKCKIEYQLNIFHKDHETIEIYSNCNEALFRMNDLKIAGAETCNIFIIIRNGNNKIIIDDIITIDFYDTCLNNEIELLRRLYIENETLKIENELYKRFLTENRATESFNKYKLKYNNLSEVF